MESVTKLVLVGMLTMVGCATATPAEQRKAAVYSCTLTLIDREISALDAEGVCSNIYNRRQERRNERP